MIDRELFMKTRVLFTVENCQYCRVWKEVIGKINSNLPVEKRIINIDCTKYHSYGLIENSLIRAYRKYLGSYPTLFFEGRKVEGANTKIELLAFLNSFLKNDHIIPPDMITFIDGKPVNLLFEKNCKYIKTLIGRRLICN